MDRDQDGRDRDGVPRRISGLPPVCGEDPVVLICGSFPGAASRIAGQYYAHPRNRFWDIVSPLAGMSTGMPYSARCHTLGEAGIALWDLVSSCHQPGSSDTAIREPLLNDIPAFLRAHPTVRSVIANGSYAGRLLFTFRGVVPVSVRFITLPSTSPANARMTTSAKARAWQDTILPLLGHRR